MPLNQSTINVHTNGFLLSQPFAINTQIYLYSCAYYLYLLSLLFTVFALILFIQLRLTCICSPSVINQKGIQHVTTCTFMCSHTHNDHYIIIQYYWEEGVKDIQKSELSMIMIWLRKMISLNHYNLANTKLVKTESIIV